MLFNSYFFLLLFLPIAVSGYYFIQTRFGHEWAKRFLLIMSLWFYGYFSVAYLVLLIGTIIINYLLTTFLTRTRETRICRKIFFSLGIIFNLGLLFIFKYYDFFVDNMNRLFSANWVLLNLLLPLGISFFTFQQLSYVIDVYRENIDMYSFLDYAVYVTFFPQLVAGPIVLHDEFIPQLNDAENHAMKEANMEKGIMAFVCGLAKKVLIADLLGGMVNWSFGNVDALSGVDAIVTMLAYTLQIYFDFSGYSDMATGIGLMFNIRLPMNFDSPYKADNNVEFWKRWHITLTRFFTRYLYIPLGGNRKGKIRTYVNILIVFLISGLWHGANWTFIFWGGVHGIANVCCRVGWKYLKRVPHVIRWMIQFVFLNITWLLFRAESITQTRELLSKVVSGSWDKLSSGMVEASGQLEYKVLIKLMNLLGQGNNAYIVYVVVLIVGALLLALIPINVQQRIDKYRMSRMQTWFLAFLFIYTVLSLTNQSTFLYFNF